MQTFLPYSDFVKSADVLDQKRLGKQRVETYQILNTLAGNTHGWRNHPAVLMWAGSELFLVRYGLAMCDVWIDRGYNDSLWPKIKRFEQSFLAGSDSPPFWWGDPELHISHQSNLVRKLPDHYKQYFPNVRADLEYYWPITNAG